MSNRQERLNSQQINESEFTDTGRLRIGTYGSSISTPVSGAKVRVTSQSDGGKTIAEMVTDSSGLGPEITLAAPPVEYSLNPDMPKPFSEYDIHVDMDGFEPADIRGVQIFSGTGSIQNILLTPLSETSAPTPITIGPPVLWGDYPPKIPEAEVKYLPPRTGFVVLPEPVVPEFIVVHDGRPTDRNAKTFWVPFTDYIKNVASSEIYATWPQETLRANILAIISITLNRVYTEWYRGQGFSFTITSSTRFDQKFIYGRNIFTEISNIVDSIFTTYITRPGISQPLFTQYCDGRRVICQYRGWMHQWGSKYLGARGYNHINILRHFYGTNMYLTQADRVQGVPMSFPGSTLHIGSSGQNVRRIQQQLNRISQNFPALPRVVVDGIYGQATRASVEKFQNIFSVPASGIVDFATWYRISHIFVGVTRMAELV
jgi:hypothetical protein